MFKHPKIGPQTAADRMERAEKRGHFSPVVGWIIHIGETLQQEGVDKVGEIVSEIQQFPYFQEEQRHCQGWAILLYFTYKVSANITHCVFHIRLMIMLNHTRLNSLV